MREVYKPILKIGKLERHDNIILGFEVSGTYLYGGTRLQKKVSRWITTQSWPITGR